MTIEPRSIREDPDDAHRHLAVWADDEAVRRRRRRESLSRQMDEATSLLDVLAEAAQSARDIILDVRGGTSLAGTLVALTTDVVCLVDQSGDEVLVSLDAIRALRADPSGSLPPPGRPGSHTVAEGDLAHALAGRAGDRPDISITFHGGPPLRGRLDWVGVDVVRMRCERTRRDLYVSLADVSWVSLESG